MNNQNLLRIFGVIVIVVIIVAAVAQLANLGNGDDTPDEDVAAVLGVSEYFDRDSEVRYTIDGPIVAREDHVALRIDISADSREIRIFKGYNNRVVESRSFENDRAAYRNFLAALAYEGFDDAEEEADLNSNELGVCPTGRRYVTEIIDNGQTVQRLWAASCSSRFGTLDANTSRLRRLFAAQIPGDVYDNLTDDLDLR